MLSCVWGLRWLKDVTKCYEKWWCPQRRCCIGKLVLPSSSPLVICHFCQNHSRNHQRHHHGDFLWDFGHCNVCFFDLAYWLLFDPCAFSSCVVFLSSVAYWCSFRPITCTCFFAVFILATGLRLKQFRDGVSSMVSYLLWRRNPIHIFSKVPQ